MVWLKQFERRRASPPQALNSVPVVSFTSLTLNRFRSESNLSGIMKFVLYFKEGGTGTFLPLFFEAIDRVRRNIAREASYIERIENGETARCLQTLSPGQPVI